MVTGSLARRYAKALLEIGIKQQNFDALGKELDRAADTLRHSPELHTALENPIFPIEKRKLILVPRETPLSLVHVKNFELLLLAGATILPANPSFYTRPQTVEQVIDTVVARVLDHLGLPQNLVPRWGEERE